MYRALNTVFSRDISAHISKFGVDEQLQAENARIHMDLVLPKINLYCLDSDELNWADFYLNESGYVRSVHWVKRYYSELSSILGRDEEEFVFFDDDTIHFLWEKPFLGRMTVNYTQQLQNWVLKSSKEYGVNSSKAMLFHFKCLVEVGE
jgi:hypothetical protein